MAVVTAVVPGVFRTGRTRKGGGNRGALRRGPMPFDGVPSGARPTDATIRPWSPASFPRPYQLRTNRTTHRLVSYQLFRFFCTRVKCLRFIWDADQKPEIWNHRPLHPTPPSARNNRSDNPSTAAVVSVAVMRNAATTAMRRRCGPPTDTHRRPSSRSARCCTPGQQTSARRPRGRPSRRLCVRCRASQRG